MSTSIYYKHNKGGVFHSKQDALESARLLKATEIWRETIVETADSTPQVTIDDKVQLNQIEKNAHLNINALNILIYLVIVVTALSIISIFVYWYQANQAVEEIRSFNYRF
jgi:hypothetical protein